MLDQNYLSVSQAIGQVSWSVSYDYVNILNFQETRNSTLEHTTQLMVMTLPCGCGEVMILPLCTQIGKRTTQIKITKKHVPLWTQTKMVNGMIMNVTTKKMATSVNVIQVQLTLKSTDI